MDEPQRSRPHWLVLDVDGVLRHWDIDHFRRSAEELGLEAAALAEIAFEEELLHRAMTGVVTAEGWAAEIGTRAATAHGVNGAAVAAAFEALGWWLDDEVVQLIAAVRRAGNRVALFSNASTALEEHLASCGVDDQVDVIFNSARLGMAKPDPLAFVEVANRLAVEPGRCLFVDDRPENVTGAREAGMVAEVFTGADALEKLLDSHDLLHAPPAP